MFYSGLKGNQSFKRDTKVPSVSYNKPKKITSLNAKKIFIQLIESFNITRKSSVDIAFQGIGFFVSTKHHDAGCPNYIFKFDYLNKTN